jgi:predicted type IV restriction endonuclease
MKARIPKTLEQLTPAEQRKIEDMVQRQIDHEEAELQKIWIALSCIILHDLYGIGKERLYKYIAAWKTMYRRNARIKTKEEQTNFIKGELDKFFPDFPFEYIESLEK